MSRLAWSLALLAFFANAQTLPTEPQPATVSGTVLGTNGVPLRKANVTLQPVQGGGRSGPVPSYTATSDGSGRFSITGIAASRYTLGADHVGYLQANYGKPGAGAMILNLLPGDQMPDITIQMIEQGVITGKVVDEDGDPVTGVQVRVMRKSYVGGTRQLAPMGFAPTNDIGEFRVAAIPPGEYYLMADSPQQRTPAVVNAEQHTGQHQQPVATYYPGVADQAAAVPLRVRAGATLAAINFQMLKASTYHIRGTVTGFVGNPGQARIGATRKDPAASFAVTVNNDGHFDIPGLPSGSWLLSVAEARNGAPATGSRVVEVAGQDVDDVVVNVNPPIQMHGTVKFDNPDHGNVRVSLQALDGPPVRPVNAQVNAEGDFTFNEPAPGRFRVDVAGIPPASYLKSVKVDGRDVLASGWDVGEAGGGSTMEIELGSPAAEIFGVLLGPDGNNAPGGVVTLAPEPVNPELPHLFYRATTDQNGRFSFPGLAPGAYRVYGWDQLEAGEQYDPDLLKAHADKSSAVTVSEGDRTLVTLTESAN